jgi:uncharacterized membrane protein YcaP (DUF421 family)
MAYVDSILKTLVSISVLFVLTRLIGKKQLAQMNHFNYISGITSGAVAASLSLNSIGYLEGIVSLIIVAAIPLLFSLLCQKSFKLNKLLEGEPMPLISKGEIIQENLKKSKLTVQDVLMLSRIAGTFDISEIESAVLEVSGKFSVLNSSTHDPLTPSDMGLSPSGMDMGIPLIINGEAIEQNLSYINSDITWLENELQKRNFEFSNVSLAYLDKSGRLKITQKD